MFNNNGVTLNELLDSFVLPNELREIHRMAHDGHYSSIDIAEAIRKVPVLSEKLLGMINSNLYHYQSPIGSIDRAITILGVEEIESLLLLIFVVSLSEEKIAKHMDLTDFWQHSVYCGVIARLIAKKNGGTHSENLFVMGGLHNVGFLLVSKLMQEVSDGNSTVSSSTFAAVGGDLLKSWGASEGFYLPIAYQLTPEGAGLYELDACILHLSVIFSSIADPYVQTAESLWQLVPIESQSILNMDENGLFSVLVQAQNDWQQVFEILMLDSSFVEF